MSRELDDAELALSRLRYASQLWELPLIPHEDVPVALGISRSAWAVLKSKGNAPEAVSIGRRAFVRAAQLRAWVDSLPAATAVETE